jgi:hypothetical protein
MRLALAALCVATSASLASAQTQSEQKQPADSQHSTGRTVLPNDNKGQLQPQGWTGPITTGSGCTPAGSPRGQSPPGMQAAPTVHQRASLIRSNATPNRKPAGINRPKPYGLCKSQGRPLVSPG